MDSLHEFLIQYGHLGVFLALLATGLGVPVPEDIILITAGVIAKETGSLLWMNVIGMVGVLLGDMVIFSAGYRYGESLLQKRPFIWLVTPERLVKVRGYYRKYGYWAIFISRFLAGLRATSFLLAGLSRVPPRIFLLADGMAALLSVPFFIFLGHHFADDITDVTNQIRRLQKDALMVGLLVIVAVLLVRRWRKRKAQAQAVVGESTADSNADQPPRKASPHD